MAGVEQYKGYSLEMDVQADMLAAMQRQAEATERLVEAVEEVARVNAAIDTTYRELFGHRSELLAALKFIGNNV